MRTSSRSSERRTRDVRRRGGVTSGSPSLSIRLSLFRLHVLTADSHREVLVAGGAHKHLHPMGLVVHMLCRGWHVADAVTPPDVGGDLLEILHDITAVFREIRDAARQPGQPLQHAAIPFPR